MFGRRDSDALARVRLAARLPAEPPDDAGQMGAEPPGPSHVDAEARHRRPGFAVSVGRFVITPAQVAVAAVCLVALMALTCWWVLQSVPTSSDVPLASGRHLPRNTPPAPSAAAPPGEAATPSGTVVVDVAGRVRRPGVVELPAGSRVVDAVEAAGGARRGVSTRSVNLARVLVDGEQILIGVRGAPAPATVAPDAGSGEVPADDGSGLLNLNTADQAALEELPGVGPVTATAILDWRTENGGFSSVDELLEVSGIGEVTLAELEPLVTV